jgi:GxxExxY protein
MQVQVNHKDSKDTKSQAAQFDELPPRTEEVAREIVDAAIKIHKALGPGLLESVYEICLCHELAKRNIPFRRQLALPVVYDGIRLETGFRIDVLADNCVIVELKTAECITPLYEAQLLTHLKLSGKRLGFLLNFNVPVMKQGIKRFVV